MDAVPVVEGDRGGLQGELGPGPPVGRNNGGMGPGRCLTGGVLDDRRGRDRRAVKEDFHQLWGRCSPTQANGSIKRWCRRAMRSQIKRIGNMETLVSR